MSKALVARGSSIELGVPPNVWNLRMLLYMFPMPGNWLNAFAKAVYFSFVAFMTLALSDLALFGLGGGSCSKQCTVVATCNEP